MSLPKMTYACMLQAAFAALALLLLASEGRAQGAPFAGMSGSWGGSGTITVSSGARESIRCRATYSVSNQGMNLQQDLRCASDSYQFNVNSSIAYADGAIFGSWSETSRGAAGSVSGRVSGGSIQASIAGIGFSASLSVRTSGGSQSVSIRPQGTDVTAVTINLSRR
jgi:hypothetical protein